MLTRLFKLANSSSSARAFCSLNKPYNSVFVRKFTESTKMSPPQALVFGFKDVEDMEFTITVDVLRRGGVDVSVANLDNEEYFTCARKNIIKQNVGFNDIKDKIFDAVIVPGGPGAYSQTENQQLGDILKKHENDKKIVAAICAAPLILATFGIGANGSITSYPSVKDKIVNLGYKYIDNQKVVIHNGNIITSRGPGTAFDFALTLLKHLVNEEKAKEIAKALLYDF